MRVAARVAELLVDRVEQAVAHRVLEHLRFVVHLVPGVPDVLHEPGLDEAVAAHHAQGEGRAILRQFDRAVRPVAHEALRGELLDHLGDR